MQATKLLLSEANTALDAAKEGQQVKAKELEEAHTALDSANQRIESCQTQIRGLTRSCYDRDKADKVIEAWSR